MNLLNKNNYIIKDYKNFFEKYGGFHDAQVSKLNIDLKTNLLTLVLNDPLVNFKGFENYKYIQNMQIIFETNLVNIKLQNLFETIFYIYDIIIQNNNVEIQFSPSGKIKLELKKDYIMVKLK